MASERRQRDLAKRGEARKAHVQARRTKSTFAAPGDDSDESSAWATCSEDDCGEENTGSDESDFLNSKSTITLTSSPHELCPICTRIWAKLPEVLDSDTFNVIDKTGSNGTYYNDGIVLETFHLTDNCPMCKLFASMKRDNGDQIDNKICQVRVFSANKVIWLLGGPGLEIFDFNVLGILSDQRRKRDPASSNTDPFRRSHEPYLGVTGYLAVLNSTAFGIRCINPATFDVAFVRNSIEFCRAHHSGLCSFGLHEIINLRVIDCRNRQIVAAPPNCQYIALSYVWGQSVPETLVSVNGVDMLPSCAKVIEDSIKVTLQLGYQYLWIDRYCINQQNPDEKLQQIRQMDSVYANAFVTIIAAAGEDPTYGLPGVNGTLRKLQPYLKIGDQVILSTLPHPRNPVGDSTWATRGWTYQEAILSTRRLIFTDEQVLFACNTMNRKEVFAMPLDKIHAQTEKLMKNYWSGALNLKHPATADPARSSTFMQYVREFSARQLGHTEDMINAMQGIFNVFANLQPPVFQFMGIELSYPRVSSSLDVDSSEPTQSDIMSAQESFLLGLFWKHLGAAKRNTSFPSWTWAGWIGRVEWNLALRSFKLHNDRTSNGLQVWIEYTPRNESNKALFRFPNWDSLPQVLSRVQIEQSLSVSIHVQAFSLDLSMAAVGKLVPEVARSFATSGLVSYLHIYARLQGAEKRTFRFRFYNDDGGYNLSHHESEFAGHFGMVISEKMNADNAAVIVLKDMEDGYFERVGLLEFESCLLDEDYAVDGYILSGKRSGSSSPASASNLSSESEAGFGRGPFRTWADKKILEECFSGIITTRRTFRIK